MGKIIGLFFIMAVVLAVLKMLPLLLKSSKPSKYPAQYDKLPGLMTPAEKLFFTSLENAVAGQYRLFSKVRLADIIQVKGNPDRSAWQRAFNAIQSKHVDFLACDPQNMSIQFVVELDDSSHQRQNRRDRDSFVDQALKTAQIPLFRFQAKGSYSVKEIQNQMFETEKLVEQGRSG